MKLDARRAAALLADPADIRVVLLYGEDNGLIRERAEALVRRVAGTLDDPFRVAELDRDGIGRIPEEVAARPLTGGRRVVRVRDITDAATAPVQAALASAAEGLLILEAGELPARSRLRSLIEAAPTAAAIACYAEQGADLQHTIAATLRDAGLTIDPDAAAWLADHLGSDRGATRRELEKLALYVHPATTVTLDDALATVGDMAGLQLDDALAAALQGDVATADRALNLAIAEGATPVGILRRLLGQLQRLDRIVASIAAGQTAAEAVRAQKPPIFFRAQPGLISASRLWTQDSLAAATAATYDAERQCKRTYTPDLTLCRQTVLAIARRAAGRRGR